MTAVAAKPDQIWLFAPHEIPEFAVPVSETSQEWADALMLQSVERIRFDPERLADYVSSVNALAKDADPCGFLDYVIQMLGGRSQ